MCGIFGILNNDESNDLKDLDLLSDSMIHRGPDDKGILNKSKWAIGMRRLSIIDISGGHQPISNSSNDIHLVCNGEIYNYISLRKSLITLGYTFKTNSDVEVILHLYQEYGCDAIHHLNGMFAFAIYDETKDLLWLARDRLGIKPLYYNFNGTNFIFSSELTGIAKITGQTLCEESIIDYLAYSYVPAPRTIFNNIYKLLPGEELVFTNKKYRFNQYWKQKNAKNWKGTIEEAHEELDYLINDSVKLQLISDVPLGIFLSGGVDSSAIASYAADNRDQPLDTFTIDFENKQGEDAYYALQISNLLNSNHHSKTFSAKEQFDAIDELIYFMDEPMSDSAIVPTYMISKEARKMGMKVLLSGAGGDEIFGGYSRYFPNKLFSAAWFSSLPKSLRPFTSFLLGKIDKSYEIRLQQPARNFISNISGINFELIKNLVINKNNFNDLIDKIDIDFNSANSKDIYSSMLLDMDTYLPNNILSLTDKASMAASIEARVPLLDHRIVEFAFSLPSEMNIYQGIQKGLFKKLLNSRLPVDLLSRKKEGFNAPINYWVEKWPDEIRDNLMKSLSPHLEQIFNKKILEKWLSKPNLRKKSGASLYSIYILNKWINTHIHN